MDAATRFIAGTRTHSLLIKRLLLNHEKKTKRVSTLFPKKKNDGTRKD